MANKKSRKKSEKKKSVDIVLALEKQFEEMDRERQEREMWKNPGPSNIGGKKRYWTNG